MSECPECPICLEALAGGVLLLSCGHSLHSRCLLACFAGELQPYEGEERHEAAWRARLGVGARRAPRTRCLPGAAGIACMLPACDAPSAGCR